MVSPTSPYRRFVGVDIAATSFTALFQTTTTPTPTDRPCTLDQTPAGFQALQERVTATGVTPAQTLIVLAATSLTRRYWPAMPLSDSPARGRRRPRFITTAAALGGAGCAPFHAPAGA
jgi:hypothetical protein